MNRKKNKVRKEGERAFNFKNLISSLLKAKYKKDFQYTHTHTHMRVIMIINVHKDLHF